MALDAPGYVCGGSCWQPPVRACQGGQCSGPPRPVHRARVYPPAPARLFLIFGVTTYSIVVTDVVSGAATLCFEIHQPTVPGVTLEKGDVNPWELMLRLGGWTSGNV